MFLLSIFFGTNAFAYKVYFSPKDNLDQVVIQEIEKAKSKIDISIYTFRSDAVVKTLVEKLKTNPNFELRLLMRRVGLESMTPYVSPLEAELKSQNLTATNIRFVNVTNHHKFMIVDGKTLLNTSGNFNSTKLAAGYDENLFVCSRTCAKLVKAFQAEFDYLYSHSNYLLLEDVMPFKANLTAPNTSEWDYVALFTSENFEPSQNKNRLIFKVKKDVDEGFVETKLIEKILSAKTSVKVATGHLRSYVLARALAQASKQGTHVELILDSQEYLSAFYQNVEEQEKAECMSKGKSLEDCVEVGFHFGRWLHEQGVNVYFKYYMVFWDFMHAPQMHHKYMIVDDEVVYTGSYNWSKNAEFKTFENKAIIKHPKTVQAYLKNFNDIKSYGEGQYETLLESWTKETNTISLVFAPMALKVPQIDNLRDVLKTRCTELFKAPDVAELDESEDEGSGKRPDRPDKHKCSVTAI